MKFPKNLFTIILFSIIAPVTFYSILFLCGVVNNLSMSYMGNTSENVSKFILDNFLSAIISFLLKVFAVYTGAAVAIGVLSAIGIISYCSLGNKSLGKKQIFFSSLTYTLLFSFLLFFRDAILYPQMYINNFSNKNAVFKCIFEFFTDYVNPVYLSVSLYLIILIPVFSFLIALFRYKKMYSFIAFLPVIVVFSFLILPNHFQQRANHSSINPAMPNILIIASDALRPDHLGGYGYFRDTSPNIDRLIQKGVSFRNAFIEVPRTFPSWVSILTGQFSATHGIRHMFPTSRDVNRNFNSIASLLNTHGFYTGVVTDYAGDIFSRIQLGFHRVDTPYFNFNYVIEQAILENHPFILPFLTGEAGLSLFPVLRDSAYFCPPALVKNRIVKALREAGDRPFFLVTFFSSTHFPYAPPYPYYKLFRSPHYNGPYRYYKQRIISLDNKSSGDDSASQDDIVQIRSLYDAGIRAMDDSVGEVLDYLKQSGKENNTIVIVLSDHGENLYEHNFGMGHGEHFRGSAAVKIPFIIHFPKMFQEKMEINQIVRHVDVMPTVLDILGLPIPEICEGKSLLPAIIHGKDLNLKAYGETGIWFDNVVRDDLFFQKQRILYPDITNLSEIDFHFDNQIVLSDEYRDLINLAKHRYMIDGRYKIIYMPLSDRIEYELFDLQKDPQELENIASLRPDVLNRMKRHLFQWITRNGETAIINEYAFPVLRY